MNRAKAIREATRKADLFGGQYVVLRRPADSDDAFHGDPGQVDADEYVYAAVRVDHASRLLFGLWEEVKPGIR